MNLKLVIEMGKPGKYLRDSKYEFQQHQKLTFPKRKCPTCGKEFYGYYKCCSPKCYRRFKGIKGWG